jgi:hypothetical protein
MALVALVAALVSVRPIWIGQPRSDERNPLVKSYSPALRANNKMRAP